MNKFMLSIALLFVVNAFADCPQFYPNGHVIVVPNTVELCNTFYANSYDLSKRAVILSVEMYRDGHHVERANSFRADMRLPLNKRATPADYHGSGYDQGHMTPAGDATDATEMNDTFLLSNMTPQEPTLNRDAWRLLEEHVRKSSPDYVVTGAIYSPSPKMIGAHNIPVPSAYYKLTYECPNIYAWKAKNLPHAPAIQTNLADIETVSGLKFPRCE